VRRNGVLGIQIASASTYSIQISPSLPAKPRSVLVQISSKWILPPLFIKIPFRTRRLHIEAVLTPSCSQEAQTSSASFIFPYFPMLYGNADQQIMLSGGSLMMRCVVSCSDVAITTNVASTSLTRIRPKLKVVHCLSDRKRSMQRQSDASQETLDSINDRALNH
jgi:hypothetical protein